MILCVQIQFSIPASAHDWDLCDETYLLAARVFVSFVIWQPRLVGVVTASPLYLSFQRLDVRLPLHVIPNRIGISRKRCSRSCVRALFRVYLVSSEKVSRVNRQKGAFSVLSPSPRIAHLETTRGYEGESSRCEVGEVRERWTIGH
jgi:hypothetical protein